MYLYILVYGLYIGRARFVTGVGAQVFGVHGEERGGQADAGVEW